MNSATRFLVSSAVLLLSSSTHPQAAGELSGEENGASADEPARLEPASGEQVIITDDDLRPFPPVEGPRGPLTNDGTEDGPPQPPLLLVPNPDVHIAKDRWFIEENREINNARSEDKVRISEETREANAKLRDKPQSERQRGQLAASEASKQKKEEVDDKADAELARIKEEYCAYWQEELSFTGQLHELQGKACAAVRDSPKCGDVFRRNLIRRGGTYIVRNEAEERAFQKEARVLYLVYKPVDAVRGPGELSNEVIIPAIQDYGGCKAKEAADLRREHCPNTLTAQRVVTRVQGKLDLHCSGGTG